MPQPTLVFNCDNSMISNIHSIDIDVMSKIQNELDTYDITSLVFLLYDIPATATALQGLILLHRVSQDIDHQNLNLLFRWASSAQSRLTWKYEFLEALAVCQLYSVIRKLGFNVQAVKRHYMPDVVDNTVYLNPMKKVLYKLCENMIEDNTVTLKKTLLTYDIDTTSFNTCELIFLELMHQKFITINTCTENRNCGHSIDLSCNVGKLTRMIENIPTLKKFAVHLKEVESKMNSKSSNNIHLTSTLVSELNSSTDKDLIHKTENKKNYQANDFEELFNAINELNLQEGSIKHLKSDTKAIDGNIYTIKNPKRIGVCCIINQEKFYPSKQSIENSATRSLENRHGSTQDKIMLQKTMRALNFEVITPNDNLNHREMIQVIKDVVKYRVQEDDSMFMLCILSHGVRGHVYAADSVKVKVEDIEKILCSDDAHVLHNIPKVLIIQACQVEDDNVQQLALVTDGPTPYILKKSHFVIYWATSPELEAFRHEQKGSIFIQILCSVLHNFGKNMHLLDLFTKVNDRVTRICEKLDRDQVPIIKTTLRKPLYLQAPE